MKRRGVDVPTSTGCYFKSPTKHKIAPALKFIGTDRESCSEKISRINLNHYVERFRLGTQVGAAGAIGALSQAFSRNKSGRSIVIVGPLVWCGYKVLEAAFIGHERSDNIT